MVDHPGTVTMVNVYEKTERTVPITEVPPNKRFVYLKDGVEISDPSQATELVPIVRVEMFSLDDDGNLVPPDLATKLWVKEFGPEKRPLRLTTMIRPK
jgi:hypothetical protein